MNPTDLTNPLTEKRIQYIMSKEIRNRKKNKTEPDIMAVSIRGMCDHEVEKGKPNYFTQVRNCILRECEQDEELFKYVLLSPSDLEDIKLSTAALIMFSEILFSYFEEDQIINLYKYMRNLDKLEQNKFKLKAIIKTFSNDELIKVLPMLNENEDTGNIIKKEMKARKIKLA